MIWPPLLDLGFENPASHPLQAQEGYAGVDMQEPELVYQSDVGRAFSQCPPLCMPLPASHCLATLDLLLQEITSALNLSFILSSRSQLLVLCSGSSILDLLR